MSESLSLSTSCGFSSCRGGTLEGAFFLFALLGGASAFLAKLAAFLASLCCFLWMTAGQVPYFLTDSTKEKPRDINSRIYSARVWPLCPDKSQSKASWSHQTSIRMAFHCLCWSLVSSSLLWSCLQWTLHKDRHVWKASNNGKNIRAPASFLPVLSLFCPWWQALWQKKKGNIYIKLCAARSLYLLFLSRLSSWSACNPSNWLCMDTWFARPSSLWVPGRTLALPQLVKPRT